MRSCRSLFGVWVCLTQQNQILSLLGPTAYSLPDRLTAISDEHQAVCTAITGLYPTVMKLARLR